MQLLYIAVHHMNPMCLANHPSELKCSLSACIVVKVQRSMLQYFDRALHQHHAICTSHHTGTIKVCRPCDKLAGTSDAPDTEPETHQ